MYTPRTDASKQGQNGWHSERPVYATATPLPENPCESSLEWEAANRSRRLQQTALCSYTTHYHPSWVWALLPQPRAMCNRSQCIGLAWSPYSIHLAISITHCSYLVPQQSPPYPWCRLAVCITFIILFTLNHAFPKKEAYACVKNPTMVFFCSTWVSPSTLYRVGTSAGLI